MIAAKHIDCRRCQGTGDAPYDTPEDRSYGPCDSCHGTGAVCRGCGVPASCECMDGCPQENRA